MGVEKKKAARQCHNNVFDLLNIRTIFFVHIYSNILLKKLAGQFERQI